MCRPLSERPHITIEKASTLCKAASTRVTEPSRSHCELTQRGTWHTSQQRSSHPCACHPRALECWNSLSDPGAERLRGVNRLNLKPRRREDVRDLDVAVGFVRMAGARARANVVVLLGVRADPVRSDEGEERHEEEHGPQVSKGDREQEEGAELGEELQLERREHGGGDDGGEHAPEDGDAERGERVVHAVDARGLAALHVRVRQMDDVVDGESREDHHGKRLGRAQLPAEHDNDAHDAADRAADGQDREGGDHDVARRKEEHKEGDEQTVRHAPERHLHVRLLQHHVEPLVLARRRAHRGDLHHVAEARRRVLVERRRERLPLAERDAQLRRRQEGVVIEE
mmetsp:Transcript_22516/g.57397  ORF Transcript_22516/g.57397 Transcript_22516/m.57397 type:complete len:342 (+) Transcript_22516:103-1128(+)